MKINFNSFSLGRCGGTRFIFELSNRLVDRGHKVTITHAGLPLLHEWYNPIKAELIECNIGLASRFLNKYGFYKINVHEAQEKNLVKAIPDCDINVATYYDTAEPTVKSGKGKLFYLIQHYEPLFFKANSLEYIAALKTYALPLKHLCVSKWLTTLVKGSFIGNGVNLSQFHPMPIKKEYDVMVIPNPTLKYKGDYTTVIKKLENLNYKVLVVKGLSELELVNAYNKSKTFLFLSEREGFAYPPLEAMACGTPVISTPCAEYFTMNSNVCLLPMNYLMDDIVDSVKCMLENKTYSEYLISYGMQTAFDFSFSKVVDRFLEAVA
jgi:hypothetical protein